MAFMAPMNKKAIEGSHNLYTIHSIKEKDYQKRMFKLRAAFPICSYGSPSIRPHPVAPYT